MSRLDGKDGVSAGRGAYYGMAKGGRGNELLWDVSSKDKSEEVGKEWLLWDIKGRGEQV